MMILLLTSLDMVLMPMEPSVGSFKGAPFEGPFLYEREYCTASGYPFEA
jgi:hypothetical protein